MNDFEKLTYYYQKGWANLEQLKLYVAFKVITPEQYTLITGFEYEVV